MLPLLRTWVAGYSLPRRFVRELSRSPAPQTGLYAALLRAGLVVLLLYLPLALMGRQPSLESALTFLPTERYYLASVFFMGPYLLLQWLCVSAGMHVVLRLSRRPSDFDRILNLNGALGIVVGAVLVAWDWLWILAGWHDEIFLGVSHLILVTWGILLGTVYLNRRLQVPVWLALVLQGASVAGSAFLSSIVVRAPV